MDDQTLAYVAEHSDRKPVVYTADEDAVYEEKYVIDLSEIKSTVAFPHLPGNTRTIDEVGDVKIDQVVIGSCTNGFYRDMEETASILKGKKVAKNVRAIIIPATQAIYLKAMENGLLKTFIEAGCVVSTPTCGPCLGGHMGILAAGERAVSTTNRNFVGRMGHPTSEVYLASPAVAAAQCHHRQNHRPEGGFGKMKFKGTVIKYGDNVDTDVIIPARYLNTIDKKELASHCMEDLDTTFTQRVKPGDIMVAGENFGCGSSREHAPLPSRKAASLWSLQRALPGFSTATPSILVLRLWNVRKQQKPLKKDIQ